MRLLRHDKVVALANDSEFNALMKQMEFEKALDFALKADKPPAPPEPPREALATPASQ